MAKRSDWIKWLAAALMLVLAYTVFYALVQRPSSDISIHAAWASEGTFTNLKSFVHHAAHPLWHMLVSALMLTGLSLNVSAAAVTAIWKAAETWLLIELSARLIGRRGWMAALCGLMLSLVSAILIPWLNPTVYLGAGSPNTWHSPTQIAVLVTMLLIVPLVSDKVTALRERQALQGAKANITWREAAVLAVLLGVSLLAKPTFMQAFLPAACLYFLVLWIRNPKNSPFFLRMILAVLPSALLMGLQYLYYFTIAPDVGAAVTLNWQKVGDVTVQVVLTRAFPIFVLATCMTREAWKKPLYQLTLLMDVVSILEMLLLSETGRRAADGNFGWAMMGSSLMLWAVTLPVFMKKLALWCRRRKAAAAGQPYLEDKPRAEVLKLSAGSALLLWHLASGVYYIVYLLTTNSSL